MDARLQRRVQRYGWDAAAAHYHEGWREQLRPVHDRLLDMAKLSSGQRVIETACGSGLVTLRLAERVGSSGGILATDLSDGMLADLRSRLRESGIRHVEVARMPAEQLDLEDDAFDAGICALGLMYAADPRSAVAEMARVVKPGGTVVASVWGERRNCGWAEVFPIVDARVASDLCPLFFATGAEGALAALFRDAGLERLQETRQSAWLDFPSAVDIVAAVLLGGPVALAVKRFGDPVWAEVREEFLSSVSPFREADGRYRIPGEFVTVQGIVMPPWFSVSE